MSAVWVRDQVVSRSGASSAARSHDTRRSENAGHAAPARPPLDVAMIVRAHGAAVRRQQVLSREQRQALRAIAVCRTPALGGTVDVCTTCGLERPVYHSCRNRHCPKCQSLAQARWIAQRMTRVLDTDYFHVVFTLPPPLALRWSPAS